MDNKRDQVQAHMFMMGRLTSGMLRADPDAPESPQGRTNRGIVIGIVVAVLVGAGAFVLGLISPGTPSSKWREEGNIVVEKETGSRYLYIGGRLRPLRNYASAKLLSAKDTKTETVSSKALAGTPHGAPVGIPGAPHFLPSAGQLDAQPWQLCSEATTAGASGKGARTITTLAVARGPLIDSLAGDQALLVTGPDSANYLLWKGSRLRLDRASSAQEALGYGSATATQVSGALLNALPSGPDLAAREVPDVGAPGPRLAGRETRIGQLFRVAVPGRAAETYQLRKDGLSPLTATQVALAVGAPTTRQLAYGGASPTVADVGSDVLRGNLARVDPTVDLTAMPSKPPQLVPVAQGQQPCAQITPAGSRAKGTSTSIGLAFAPELGTLAEPGPEGVVRACLPVDRITVPAGRGVVVRALSGAGTKIGTTLYLVTDAGVKYRVASGAAASALGYADASAEGLPSLLLAMLPTGPDLSPEAAERGVAVTTAPRCAQSLPTVGKGTTNTTN
ncbi:type VII secretion protein EccB [Streptomyces sp. NPDC050848]|uniref:type VII secretion protein EccB n=1 Tax=Streptomyces sp. NPDC050848 TaxID=3155791 RepID=UPI0033C5897C